MKLFEVLPLILYGIVYFLYDKILALLSPQLSQQWQQTLTDTEPFFAALVVFLIATVFALAINKYKQGEFGKMNLVTAAVVLATGLPAIIFDSAILFMLKPSIVFFGFAIAAPICWWVFKCSVSEKLWISILGNVKLEIEADAQFWQKMDIAHILFYLSLTLLNLFIAFNFSEQTWVSFKLFALMPISMVFMMGQMYFVFKRSKEIDSTDKTDSI